MDGRSAKAGRLSASLRECSRAGANQVQLVALLDAGIDFSIVALNSIDLTYERSALAVADQLTLKPSVMSPVQGGASQL